MKTRSNIQVLMQLIQLIYSLMPYMIIAIIMGVIGFLCAIAIPVLGAMGIISLLNIEMPLNLNTIFILLFVCALIRGILRYAEQACNHYIAFKLLAKIRDQVFTVLRKLAPAKLEGKEKGNLISLITSDIELLEVFYAHTISPICIAFLVSLILILLIGQYHILLGLWACLAYCFVGIVIPYAFSRKSSQVGIQYRQKAGVLNTYVLESMRGLKESLQYNQTQTRLEGIYQKSEELSVEEEKMKKLQAKNTALTNAAVLVLSFGMFLVATVLYTKGAIPLEAVILSSVIQISSFGPVIALANLGTGLAQTIGAGNRVLDLLEEKPVIEEITNQENIQDLDTIHIDAIDFTYQEEKILENFNLSVQKNEVLGIQGKSGSGKSTLLKLLMRFWTVQKGEIILSDKNINTINTSSLRQLESYVTQETYLFHDTIENNIRIAKQDATPEEIQEACKKANIHDFIMTLPNQYQTSIGELGSTLSGGERQRLGLARSFLHDGKLVLFDEPTSNLDSLNEGAVLKSIYEQRKDKTILLVSHRLSSLKMCDRIFKMTTERNS